MQTLQRNKHTTLTTAICFCLFNVLLALCIFQFATCAQSVDFVNFDISKDTALPTFYEVRNKQRQLKCLTACKLSANCTACLYQLSTSVCFLSTDSLNNAVPSPGVTMFSKRPCEGTIYQDRCIVFVATFHTWPDGKSYCRSRGGHLAVPYTADHVGFFLNYAVAMGCVETGYCFPWIGVHDSNVEGTAEAVNGATLPAEVVGLLKDNSEDADCIYIAVGSESVLFYYAYYDMAPIICEFAV